MRRNLIVYAAPKQTEQVLRHSSQTVLNPQFLSQPPASPQNAFHPHGYNHITPTHTNDSFPVLVALMGIYASRTYPYCGNPFHMYPSRPSRMRCMPTEAWRGYRHTTQGLQRFAARSGGSQSVSLFSYAVCPYSANRFLSGYKVGE